MIFKRLIAIVLAFGFLPASAFAENQTDEPVEEMNSIQSDDRFYMMTALGILNGYENIAEYFDIPYVSREEYCEMIASILTDEIPAAGKSCPFIDIDDSANKDAISYLWELNIVSGANREEFNPKLAVTLEQAVIIAVRALGYDFYVENFSDINYRTVALKYGFLKGISGDLSEPMSKTQLLDLMENIIDIEPFGVEITGENGPSYGVHDNGTILELYRDIYTDEGIMTANAYTNEFSIKSNINADLIIDNITYDDDSYQDKTNFLGMNVEVYYKLDNGNRTALYIVPKEKKNREITILSEDISEPVTRETIVYEQGTKTKKAKLSRALKVIYNGAAYIDYDISDLKPEYGNIRLLDNDGDEVFDYAFVTSYELMWFDRYSALEKKIYNRLQTGVSEILVEDPQIERNLYIERDGEKTDRFGINSGDVILALKSRNEGDKVIKIYASSKTVGGVLDSNNINQSGETELVIDNEKYLLNPITALAIESGDSALVNLEIGKSYKFFIDYNGRIAAFENSSDDTMLYGYMKKVYYHEDNERFSCKMFMQDGSWQNIYFSEKVRLNNNSVKDEDLYEILAPGGVTSPQMLRFRLVNNEIKFADTAIESDKYKKDMFTTSGIKEFMYVGTTKNLGDRYFFNSDAKIFVIPTDKAAEEDDYRIEGPNILRTESARYNIEVYDEDNFGHSSIFKLEQSLSQMKDNNKSYVYSVVRNISTMVDEKGIIRSVLNCASNGEEKSLYYGKDEYTFNDLKIGDVIQISKNFDGYVTGYEKVFSKSEIGTLSDSGEPDMYNRSIDISGYVLDVDAVRRVLKMRINDKDNVYLKNDSDPNVVLVEGGHVRVGTIKDVIAGDYIAGRVGYGRIADIIIYRD